MKISFCITCKNRLYQIAKTLRKNLSDNSLNQKDVEFVLVDFASEDGLKDWVISNFKDELRSEYLKYFYTDELKHWDMSVTKNTAHILAEGEILVNLDCDNFTGRNGAEYVKKQFLIYGKNLLLHQTSGDPRDGSHGRIAMSSRYFHLIGGYNEEFDPMGYQDVDLIQRLVKVGLVYTPKCNLAYSRAIPNEKTESVRYVDSEKSYGEMCRQNMLLSEKNLRSGNIQANYGIYGIRKNIFRYIDESFHPAFLT